jgi:DNA-3-methyladenine glycosylase II
MAANAIGWDAGRMNAATRHLARTDPVFAALIRRVGRCALAVDREEPYAALVSAITHQQLHGRAARAIFARFVALYPGPGFPSPAQILSTPEAALRGCGLSANKILAVRDIAARTAEGLVPSRRAAARLSDAVLIERLTAIRGVGRWTVEMLLIHTLGRPDILPVDDFGVREGFRRLHRLQAQPKPRELAAIGEAWAPCRSTAAWYLWRAAELPES